MGKIKQAALVGLIGLAVGGCANLPNVYRNGLTVDSRDYVKVAREEISFGSDLENRARLSYVLDGCCNNIGNNFKIGVFSDGKDGIAYSKWGKGSDEVLIYLNGLESHAGWFSEVANRFADDGLVVYGVDRRGSGLNSRINGNGKSWMRDVGRVIDIARSENSGCDINLVSLCFGARLATAYVVENPGDVDSLVYISPGFNVKVGPNLLEKSGILLDTVGFQTNTRSPIRDDRMFTDNVRRLEFLRNDKLRTVASSSDDYLDGENLMSGVRGRLGEVGVRSFVLLAERDKIVDNDKTRVTLGKFGEEPRIIEYPCEHTVFFDDSVVSKFLKDVEGFVFDK